MNTLLSYRYMMLVVCYMLCFVRFVLLFFFVLVCFVVMLVFLFRQKQQRQRRKMEDSSSSSSINSENRKNRKRDTTGEDREKKPLLSYSGLDRDLETQIDKELAQHYGDEDLYAFGYTGSTSYRCSATVKISVLVLVFVLLIGLVVVAVELIDRLQIVEVRCIDACICIVNYCSFYFIVFKCVYICSTSQHGTSTFMSNWAQSVSGWPLRSMNK